MNINSLAQELIGSNDVSKILSVLYVCYREGYEDGAKNDWWKSREKTKDITERLIKEYRGENNLDE